MRSIMRGWILPGWIMQWWTAPLHPALRIQKKVSGYYNSLAGLQSADDLHAISQAPPGFHRAGFEDSTAPLNEDNLAEPGLDKSIHWYRHRCGEGR